MLFKWQLALLIFKVTLVLSASIDKEQPACCTTSQCIAASHRIFESMNLDADPCEDFDEFACGGWKKKHAIPDDKGNLNQMSLMTETLIKNCRKIIEAPITNDDFESHKKAKLFYKSCMNSEKLEALGVQPLKNLLDLFGWPVLQESWNRGEKFDPWQFVIKRNQLGLPDDYLLTFSIQPDSQNTTRRALQINHPRFGPTKEFLDKGWDDPVIKAYYKYTLNR